MKKLVAGNLCSQLATQIPEFCVSHSPVALKPVAFTRQIAHPNAQKMQLRATLALDLSTALGYETLGSARIFQHNAWCY